MPPIKVLIVDDEANIRSLVQCCLEDNGSEIMQASNGIEALSALEAHRPDLMILDLAMPLLDGMSVLAEMKHLWSRLPTRVIVVTAHGSVKTAIEALRLGASDFIEKPFSPDELRQSVQAVFRKLPQVEEVEEGYAQTLLAVRAALQARQFAQAERKLMKAGTITAEEPTFLNLAGILHESLGRQESARKFYSRAVSKDRTYRPAQANLERLGEIRRNGRSKIPVAFGGEELDAGSEGPRFTASESDNSNLTPSSTKHAIRTDQLTLLQSRQESDDESVRLLHQRGARIHGAVRRLSEWRPRKQVRMH
jgi:DNA-binding response OmpR family regulator